MGSWELGVRGTEEEEVVEVSLSQAWIIYIKVRLRNIRSMYLARMISWRS